MILQDKAFFQKIKYVPSIAKFALFLSKLETSHIAQFPHHDAEKSLLRSNPLYDS